MLSATPVNTSLIDLRNQIYLMTEGRQNTFRESLGVSDIGNLLKRAQTQFKQWETQAPLNGQRNKKEFLDNLGSDFYRLLGGISIARSRRQIEEFYAAEIDRIGRFPDRAKPVNVYPPTDMEGGLSYKELADLITQFTLSIYRPSDYVVSEKGLQQLEEEKKARNFNQADRERLIGAGL